jgi:hypothetical protein
MLLLYQYLFEGYPLKVLSPSRVLMFLFFSLVGFIIRHLPFLTFRNMYLFEEMFLKGLSRPPLNGFVLKGMKMVVYPGLGRVFFIKDEPSLF